MSVLAASVQFFRWRQNGLAAYNYGVDNNDVDVVGDDDDDDVDDVDVDGDDDDQSSDRGLLLLLWNLPIHELSMSHRQSHNFCLQNHFPLILFYLLFWFCFIFQFYLLLFFVLPFLDLFWSPWYGVQSVYVIIMYLPMNIL